MFLFTLAAQNHHWAKHAKNATRRARAEAERASRVLEAAARLMDPDAVFEAADIDPPIVLMPWMNEVGNDDPTPVDYRPGRNKK